MKRTYPAFIAPSDSDYLVYVPDMDICTEGKSLTDTIGMARDAIGLKSINFEDDKKEIPGASDYQLATARAREDTEDFDYTKGMLTMVDVNFEEYRRKRNRKMVRGNMTLPNWLNIEAEKQKLNISKVLQEALIEKVEQMR